MPENNAPPNADGYGYQVSGWVKEAVEESDGFLRSQVGYNKCDEAIQAIMGEQQDLRSVSLSGTTCNLTSKTFFDMAAGLTDLKPFWEYKTFNRRFESHTAIYGKCSEHVWTNRGMDMSFLYAVQYALACGSSYFQPYWDTQTEDFAADAWDPRDVLPIRPTVSPSIQDCYGVTARKTHTINHIKYLVQHVYKRPELLKYIYPNNDGASISGTLRNTRVGALLQRLGHSPFQQRLFGEQARRDISRVPSSTLFTTYVNDDAVNESTSPVYMGSFGDDGKPLNNWSYIAEKGDRLYPRKRMIVTVSGCPEPLYDGPSPWWHGRFPYPKLTLDPVPWSYLGKGPVWDLLPMNRALDKLLRVYDDWAERLARPDIIGDKNAISEHMMQRLDPRRSGKKVRINPTAGKGLQIIGPDPLPPDFWKGIEFYEAKIRELSGAQDVSSLMNLNQLPSSDSIEQLMQSMSLIWRLRSRVIEVFMREFATMMAYNFAQFYTLGRRLTIMGGEGMTAQDFDFDPGSLVPDFLNASDYDSEGKLTREAMDRGPLPRYDRAREFLRQFSFHIAPGSLLAVSELQRKMMYLQLSRAGLVDVWTLLDVLGIPNVGSPPVGVQTIPERLAAQQQMGFMMDVNPAGRKASGQSSPRMVTKES